ncbi:MAG: sulfatase, partial [Chlorobi bacterium]|nr:sulfatase [Chlorobiota bacterium]
MKHARFIPLFVWLIILLVPACNVHQPGNNTSRPNIIYIMSDDHGYQALSCYDSTLIRTPNLDRIASEGVLFSRAFVTNSLCAPSRAALLTGKFSNKNGLYINRGGYNLFDSSQVTFPKLLQQAGYQTAIVGKWHLRSTPTGFDYWNILPGQGQYYNPDFIEMGNRKRIEGYVTNLITDAALRWLRNRDKAKPFCLLIHEKAPHRPWMPDTTDLHLFEDENFPVPENFFDDYAGRRGAKEQKMSVIEDMDIVYDLKMVDREGEIKGRYRRAMEGMLARMTPEQRKAWDAEYLPKAEAFKNAGLSGKQLAVWKLQRYLTDYLRCVAGVDRNTGRLLAYLDSSGLAENTVVVYSSDQGFYLGEHGWFDKRFMYEESFRTPLIMRYPGMKKRGEIPALVQNIDLASTFLDIAGAPIPAEMQGRSLIPLLENETAPPGWRDALYYHYYEFPSEHFTRRHYGIRTQRYKLIRFYYDFNEWELFDLKKDPHEMNNLYPNPDFKPLSDSLKKMLDSLRV